MASFTFHTNKRTHLMFSSCGTSPTTLGGGEPGPGSVKAAWGRKVRSIQPWRGVVVCGLGGQVNDAFKSFAYLVVHFHADRSHP